MKVFKPGANSDLNQLLTVMKLASIKLTLVGRNKSVPYLLFSTIYFKSNLSVANPYFQEQKPLKTLYRK